MDFNEAEPDHQIPSEYKKMFLKMASIQKTFIGTVTNIAIIVKLVCNQTQNGVT